MTTERFLDYIAYEKRYSLNTINAYRSDLDQFFNFLTEQYKINDIHQVDHQVVRSWMVSMMEDGHTSRTVNRIDDILVKHIKLYRVSWLAPLVLLYLFSGMLPDYQEAARKAALFLILWLLVVTITSILNAGWRDSMDFLARLESG